MLLLLGLLVPVAGGKWGSYIGLPNHGVFLSDVFLLSGSIGLAVSGPPRAATDESRGTRGTLRFASIAVMVGLIFASYELFRGSGSALLRMRDLAPYAYLCLFPIVATAFRVLGRRIVIEWIDRALFAHAAWCTPALLGLLAPLSLPAAVFGFPVFQTRPDIDVLLLAAFIGGTLRRWRMAPTLRMAAIGLVLIAMVVQSSRAALAGGLVGLALTSVLARERGLRRRTIIVTCAVISAVTLGVMFSSISPSRLLGSGAIARAGLVPSAQLAAAGGRGTAGARTDAWDLMLRYYDESGSPLFGLGPGSEIVRDSGAVAFLSGDLSVRAPHSWWVDVWVRFGPVGTAVWLLLLFSAVRSARGGAWPSTRFRAERGMGAGLLLSILIASSLGVVIESPFGSQTLLLAAVLMSTSPGRGGAVKRLDRAGSAQRVTELNTRLLRQRKLSTLAEK